MSVFAFYNHCPRYHHGLSKREHMEQVTGSYFLAAYGLHARRRMQCYGMAAVLWKWCTKNRVDGPCSPALKARIRRVTRKRARREGKRWLQEVSA